MRRLTFLLLLIGCSTYPKLDDLTRSPAQENFSAEAYGNFFQKLDLTDVTEQEYQSKFEEILGRKLKIERRSFHLPRNARILNHSNWSIELPQLNTGSLARYTNYILNVPFGRLSRTQFQNLQSRFKNTHGVWSSSKDYSIVDFLPPAAQALYGQLYIHNRYTYNREQRPWHYEFEEITNEGQISRITNCWQAAWEYLKEPDDLVTIFFADENHIRPIFENNKLSEIISEHQGPRVYEYYQNSKNVFRKLEPGDVVLIYQKMQNMAQGEFEALAHVAVVVDQNLIFEKNNPSSSHPYRLSYLTDSLDALIDKQNKDTATTKEDLESLRVVVRRFNRRFQSIEHYVNMNLKPGAFLDQKEVKRSSRPDLNFLQSHTVVSEIGTGGTIISEDLYKIEKMKIFPTEKGFGIENHFRYP